MRKNPEQPIAPETISPEEKERQDFRKKWFQIFTPEETKQLIQEQTKIQPSTDFFFRTSSKHIERTPKKRSWSTSFIHTYIYLRENMLDRLEDQIKDPKYHSYFPAMINSQELFTPIFKIINTRKFKKQLKKSIYPGLEQDSGEQIINETLVDQNKIITISNPNQIAELKKIWLENCVASDQQEWVNKHLDNLINYFTDIEKSKEIIEQREQEKES